MLCEINAVTSLNEMLASTNFLKFLWLHILFQVNRLAVVVQLLLGEIPDRKTFREAHLKKTLVPYYRLTQGNVRMYRILKLSNKINHLHERTLRIVFRDTFKVFKSCYIGIGPKISVNFLRFK